MKFAIYIYTNKATIYLCATLYTQLPTMRCTIITDNGMAHSNETLSSFEDMRKHILEELNH